MAVIDFPARPVPLTDEMVVELETMSDAKSMFPMKGAFLTDDDVVASACFPLLEPLKYGLGFYLFADHFHERGDETGEAKELVVGPTGLILGMPIALGARHGDARHRLIAGYRWAESVCAQANADSGTTGSEGARHE